MKIDPIRMPPNPVTNILAADAAKRMKAAARKKRPQPVQKKDIFVLSEQARELAARLPGKTDAEKAKEPPDNKDREEQTKQSK